MELERLKGRGHLVPTMTTGIEYQVHYEIHFPVVEERPGRHMTPNHTSASKCCVQSSHRHLIPDGHYFLHADVGQIHQLKFINRKWHYLATR
jgi:hypothetical protein